MDPIPLNAVRAAADVAADTSGTAVAAPVADIVGAAADNAAVARAAALADTAGDTVVVAADAAADTAAVELMRGLLLSLMQRLMLRLPLIRRATFTVALAASAVIVASTSPAPPAASGFEISGQGMVVVGPVRAPINLLHANESTLQFG